MNRRRGRFIGEPHGRGKEDEGKNHNLGGSQAQNESSRPFSKAVRLTTPHGDSLTKNSQQVRDLRPLHKSTADSLIEAEKVKKPVIENLIDKRSLF
jgi:hypothetical protein